MRLIAVISLVLISFSSFAGKKIYLEYFPSGSLKAEYKFIGKKGVRVVFYHENGVVRETGFIKDGKAHGRWINYDESGNKITEATFDKDKKLGRWFHWDSSGKLKLTTDFAQNELIRYDLWDKDGNYTSYVLR